MLGYCVFLFSAFAHVSLLFVLCGAMIYSSCFLGVCFHANGMKRPCKWLHVVTSSMLFRLVHNSSAGARCFGVCVCRLWVPVWEASCTACAIVFRVDRRTAIPSSRYFKDWYTWVWKLKSPLLIHSKLKMDDFVHQILSTEMTPNCQLMSPW